MRKATLNTKISRLVLLVAVLASVSTAALAVSPSSEAAVTTCAADFTPGATTAQRICTTESDDWSGGYHFYTRVQLRQNYYYSVMRWVTWQVIEQQWRDYGGYWYPILCRITVVGAVSYC